MIFQTLQNAVDAWQGLTPAQRDVVLKVRLEVFCDCGCGLRINHAQVLKAQVTNFATPQCRERYNQNKS
jgi:hypothetical protein